MDSSQALPRQGATGRLAHPDRPSTTRLRRLLLRHYDRSRRELPWRGERDAYRVWVSEVMLQQTRVETVIPYYARWLDRFPDVDALADATEDEVLEAWRGLGYYSRARNLRRAAAVVRDRHQGVPPRRMEELLALPGVGRYTAGAMASIAFGAAVPAVDGNARRVLSRLFDLPSPTAARLEQLAARIVDPERPGDFNQALMDLGATLCTARAPRCQLCPLASLCMARAAGTTEDRPRRPQRRRAPERCFAVAVLVDPRERVLLVRRPRAGLLAGLWAFPEAELAGTGNAAASVRRTARTLALTPMGRAQRLGEVAHAFTHLRARYLPVLLRTSDRGARESDRRWVDPSRLGSLAVPSAQLRIAELAALALTRTPQATSTKRPTIRLDRSAAR